MPMKICVSGWYFERDLFEIFKEVSKKYEIVVVTYFRRSNGGITRDYDPIPVPDMIKEWVLPSGVTHWEIPVAGLEWGGYDHYLKNIWDRESDVLFMHDDMRVSDPAVFDRIAELPHDQAYIFRDLSEELANGRKHGRGVYCSKRFLEYMMNYVCMCGQANDHDHPHHPGNILRGTGPHTGFWYDPYNLGEHTNGAVPLHCRHYNAGVYHFAAFAGRCVRTDRHWPGFDSGVRVHLPEFNAGRRGTWRHVEKEIARYGDAAN